MTKRPKPSDRSVREAAELRLFVQQYARKSRSGFDPNDRRYDRKVETAVKRMKPDKLDALLRHGEDDEP